MSKSKSQTLQNPYRKLPSLNGWLKTANTLSWISLFVKWKTDKASQELFATEAGQLIHVAAEGDDLPIGGLIAKIDTSAEAPAKKEEPAAVEEKAEAKEEVKAAPAAEKKVEETVATYATGHQPPAAAKLIAENNLDPAKITGTGKDGRITKADVLQAIKAGTATINMDYRALLNGNSAAERTSESKRLSRIRKTIAERLVFAKNSTAMLTTFNEVDCTAMKRIRAQYKEKFKEKFGIGLGYMSFFTKACSIALMKFPAVNAYIDVEEGAMTYHNYADVSIAVSTPKGLVVPVIRNAESLSMADIEKEVKRLALRGRDGKLDMEEMTGGTFTITNGGVFGSLLSTPILNPPQSAILGMHKIEDRPVAINGNVEVRPMMYLALSYDHRIVDGKESVSFLVTVKDLLENPEKMLFGEDPVELLLGF